MQASEAAARRATEVLSGIGSEKTTFSTPRARSISASRRLPSPCRTKVTSGACGAASTTWVRSLASPMVPKYEQTKPSPRPSRSRMSEPSSSGSNMSRSEALGIIETRSGGTPAATTPSRMPGESAFTWAELR